MTDTKVKKIALVLGSGGARGLAHIGVIEVLEERGYEITSISGASIGSVIGGVYAGGNLNKYKDWILSLDRRKVFSLMDFTLKSHGFIKGERVFDEMRKFVGVDKIEDLKIPFSAIAVDLENQKEVVFDSGDLWTAVRASVAIPSVLTPVTHNNMLLVDGGVVNPLPVNRVKRTDNDILLAVDLNSLEGSLPLPKSIREEKENSEQNKFIESVRQNVGEWWPWTESGKESSKSKNSSRLKQNYLGILNASLEMMQDQVAQLAMESSKPDVLIKVSSRAASTFDFYLGKELIQMGRDLANKALDDFEKQ